MIDKTLIFYCFVSGLVSAITCNICMFVKERRKTKKNRRGIYIESLPYFTNGKGL